MQDSLQVSCDLRAGGKIFRLERNFYRKEKSVSLVCETNGEVLSVEKGDLQVLMEGMNEDAFRNTVFFNQQSAATDEGLARELRNYMTNLQNSGDGEMNVSAAIKSLKAETASGIRTEASGCRTGRRAGKPADASGVRASGTAGAVRRTETL